MYGAPHLVNHLAAKAVSNEYFDIVDDEIDLWSPFSCKAEYWLAHLYAKHNLSSLAHSMLFRNPKMAIVSYFTLFPTLFIMLYEMSWMIGIDTLKSCKVCFNRLANPNNLCDDDCTLVIVLLSSGMHWVHHATACIRGIYVVCSSKGIQWCWGTCLLRGDIKRLVVEWTGTYGEFRHRYDDSDCFNSYGGQRELRLSLYSAVQTRHILEIIQATRRNGQ